MLVINEKLSIPGDQLSLSYARSSGPGGQNVNKVNSKATLEWSIMESDALPERAKARFIEKFSNRINQAGFLIVISDRFRDRLKNVKDCETKLRDMILECLAEPKKRRPTKPSRSSVRKAISGKKQHADKKKNRQKIVV